MALPCYMAMTSAEFAGAEIIPSYPAWMACHFSCYGSGLSNLPENFPQGSMIILNDRTPICGHQPDIILQELEILIDKLHPSCLLLDFQRQGNEETARLTDFLCQALPCPVGVSHLYTGDLGCPVFLPPPPLPRPLEEYLSPWKGREIWLEISPETACITVTPDGSTIQCNTPVHLNDPVFVSEELACQYHIELLNNAAQFHMERDLDIYRQKAERCGVAFLIGLYQELN